MIQQPLFIFIFLILLEAAILFADKHSVTKKFFAILPAVFWIYFLPMLSSSVGLVSSQSPLYGWAVTYALPASLFILLLGVDLKAIARLGRVGLGMFLAGSLGIMIGTTIVFSVMQSVVGAEFWGGFGALSGSWMGGSANMVAVKEAVGTPDDVFLPMVVVDTIVPYVWMGFLVILSTKQKFIDHWTRADRTQLDAIHQRIVAEANSEKNEFRLLTMVIVLMMGFTVSLLLQWASQFLPVVSGIISPFTWVIILASICGLIGSFTPLHRVIRSGSNGLGYFILFFVLMTIGAKASLSHLQTSGILIVGGFGIVAIHAIVLVIAMRWMKAPVMLAAAASQANMGGVASAPLVAEIYQPGLSAIGLLMAVFGNVVGTYLGILVGQVCRVMAGI